MSRTPFAKLAALMLFLSAGVSFADNAYSGTIQDGGYITVPDGTVDNWAIMLAPSVMGNEEYNSEGDNALLRMEVYTQKINPYTWRIVARFKYKYANLYDSGNGDWFSGTANYMLVRKN